MEHRYSDRSTAELNIAIYKQNLLVALGVVKNIGTAGVYIESGFNELTTNQPLEIEFFPSEKSRNQRFKAVVVHRNHQGFGVEIEGIAEQLRLADRAKSSPQRRRPAAGHTVSPNTAPTNTAVANRAAPIAGSGAGYASL